MDTQSKYVATVVVIAYGRTTVLNLDSETSSCFDNARLYQLSRKLDYAYANCIADGNTTNDLKHLFRRDLTNQTTFDVIQQHIDDSTPRYIKIQKGYGTYTDDDIGQLYDPITFDKVIHTFGSTSAANSLINRTMNRLVFENKFGVFLLSVHKKVTHGDINSLQLVYPTNPDDLSINLLHLNDYGALVDYFPERVSSIDRALAKIETENIADIPEHIPSHEKPLIFDKNKTNKVYARNDEIRIVRLSYIPCILKEIFGKDTYVNIMDYSCSVLPDDFPENEKIYTQYIRPTHTSKMTDLEMGSNRKTGGKKTYRSILKKKHTRKSTASNKKKAKVRFSRSVRNKKNTLRKARNRTSRQKKRTHKTTKKNGKRGGSDNEKTSHLAPIQPVANSHPFSGNSSLSTLTNSQDPSLLHEPVGEDADAVSRPIYANDELNSYDYSSHRSSSSSSESNRSSMSSLGDFEVSDEEKLRNIIETIHTHLFFIYADSDYSTSWLNESINSLDPYDLYRKIEYIIEEVEKMNPDSDLSRIRHRDVIESLNIIFELVPNTRPETPVEEFMGGKRGKKRKSRK
jgi:hypothetical protein